MNQNIKRTAFALGTVVAVSFLTPPLYAGEKYWLTVSYATEW